MSVFLLAIKPVWNKQWFFFHVYITNNSKNTADGYTLGHCGLHGSHLLLATTGCFVSAMLNQLQYFVVYFLNPVQLSTGYLHRKRTFLTSVSDILLCALFDYSVPYLTLLNESKQKQSQYYWSFKQRTRLTPGHLVHLLGRRGVLLF